jgi:uncharacterized protein
MATIAQTTPFSDVIQQLVSDQYFNQLLSAGATLPIVWTTTNVSPAFVVSPNGNITTSALQNPGSYTASGTMVDANHNTGLWTFTLTVLTATPTPQTTVIPTAALAPTGIEVQVPFQINPATGQVGTVNEYSTIIAQHVLSILMTATGERLMLPTYGVGMETYTFQPDSPLVGAEIQSAVQNAFTGWEPAVQILNVSVTQSPQNPAVMNVTIQYSTPYSGTNTITVSLGGAVPSAQITTIGTFNP